MRLTGYMVVDDEVELGDAVSQEDVVDAVLAICEACLLRSGEAGTVDGFVSFACDPANLYEGIDYEGIPLEVEDEEALRKLRSLIAPREPEGGDDQGAIFAPNRGAYVLFAMHPSATIRAALRLTLPSRLDRVERLTGYRPDCGRSGRGRGAP